VHLVIGAGSYAGQAVTAALAGRVRVGRAEPSEDLETAMTGAEVVHLALPLRSPLEEPFLGPHPLLAEVARAAARAGVRRLVYLSSVHVLGGHDGRITERTLPQPRLAYERAVAADETWLRQQGGFDVVTVRPAQVLAADEPVTTRLLRQLATGRLLIPGGGRAPCTFVAGSDLGTALAAAGLRGAPGASYLVGGFLASWREVVEALAAAAGLPSRLAWLPQEVAHLAASARRLMPGQERWTRSALELISRPCVVADGWSRRELGWWPAVGDARGAALELAPALRRQLAAPQPVPSERLARDDA
jgi:UDP-glucose 4-epimerase